MNEYQSVSKQHTDDKKDKFILILLFIVMTGVLVGTLSFCRMGEESLSRLNLLERGFMQTRSDDSFTKIVYDSIRSGSTLIILSFILGFSAISQPVEMLIPFFRGLGLGVSIAQVYASNGAKGAIIVLLLIVPYAVISTFGIIVAVRESAKFSTILSSVTLSKRIEHDMSEVTKLYCAKFLIIEALIVIASILDGVCSTLFADILLRNI